MTGDMDKDMDMKSHEPARGQAGGGAGHGSMSGSDAMSGPGKEPGLMMGEHHEKTKWVYPVVIALGAWLIASPATLGYQSQNLTWSDIISGGLVMVLGFLSLKKGRGWAAFGSAGVGVWLIFAPIFFWAPDAASYLNDSLVGALLVGFAILIPHGTEMPGPQIPPGWSYNPSSWPQRAPIIALALVGFFLSRQMATFELGHITSFPDPFFGRGTVRVLTSDVSRSFPIPDAGLGAFAYMIEFLMGFMGDKRRWRTMPWMVTFFGILVVPLGVVSITLIILQPLAVGAWCTPCLIAAAAMLIMIALTLDEVVAMLQFLAQSRREGQPLWRTFWMGGTLKDLPDTGPIRPDEVSAKAMIWGVALPWNLLLSTGLGLWLMASPSVFGSTGTAAHSDHLLGAIIVTISVISLADVGRAMRYLNVLLGVAVIAAPWVVGGASTTSRWNDAIAATLVILLSLPRGKVNERYGTWKYLIR